MHGGDLVGDVLRAQGVEFLFTLCGGHISPVLIGAKARGIRVVDTRHEATAVFAADAVARLTGRPGVAAVTAGPGLTNTITAVKNAQLAQSPVVLIGGAAPTVLQGRGALQDIDQMALLRPHVKWMAGVRRVRDIAPALAEAFLGGALDEAGLWESRGPLPEPVVTEFGALVSAAAQPIDDVRGTAAYRRHALAVLARRTLSWAWKDYQRAGSGDGLAGAAGGKG